MTNPFSHFWLFVWLVLSHTVTLAAGCVVTVMIGIIEKYVLKKPLSLRIGIGILLSFLFFASFQSWYDQYQKTVVAQSETDQIRRELEKLTMPQLVGEITGVTTGPAGKHDVDTLMSVWIVIRNLGAPSIVQNISLEVRFPNGKTKELALLPRTKTPIQLEGYHPGEGVILPPEDFFTVKAMATTIATGGAVEGWEWGLVRGVTAKEIRESNAIVVMKFNDVRGRPGEVKGRIGPGVPIRFNPKMIQPNP